MPRYQFERESRTPHSEGYVIHEGALELGRVDLHFAGEMAFATICVPEAFTEENIQEIISQVDERLVMSAMPFREDFVATVWLGRQAGVYSEETEAEYGEETEGNGLQEEGSKGG